MRPTKILSEKALFSVWKKSRDYGSNPGGPGTDKMSADIFKSNHKHLISQLAAEIKNGSYRQSSLRLALIPKGEKSYRPVCIPTIKDRIVQRTINRYLMGDTVKLGMSKQVSFGFLKGHGSASDAVKLAVQKRSKNNYVVKTDISKFFDEIERKQLILKIKSIRMSPSLITPLTNIINTEVRVQTGQEKSRFTKSGLLKNVGLRQGMPLSPLLASIYLRKFDTSLVANKHSFLRYADDLIIFGKSADAAIAGFQHARKLLSDLGLQVPDLGTKKSQLRKPRESVEYLGQEIRYHQPSDSYQIRIPQNTIARVLKEIGEIDLATSIHNKNTLSNVFRTLDGRGSAFNVYYKDATNLKLFKQLVTDEIRKTKKQIFFDLFGEEAWGKLQPNEKRFLGWG